MKGNLFHDKDFGKSISGLSRFPLFCSCLFVKAQCEKVLNPDNYFDGTLRNFIGLQHYGSCDVSTLPPLTTSVSKIMAAITTGTSGAGSTTTSFTTASAQTTTDSGHVLTGDVFCQYKDSLNCISSLNMVCATNGKFYPNMYVFQRFSSSLVYTFFKQSPKITV